MSGYQVTEEEMRRLCAPTPYVRRPVIYHLVEVPSNKPKETWLERESRLSAERERRKELAEKANTLFMPVDSGEYLYYHPKTGRFVTLGWHDFDYNEIILTPEQMQEAREAFKKRWPNDRYGTSFYDTHTGTFPS